MHDAKEQNIRRRLYLDHNLLIVFSITLTAIMSVSSITPALPKVMRELDISPRSVGLLITVFTMPGIILTPVFGILADRFGRKRIVVPSLLLFGIAGGICGFIKDFELLLVLRFIQGIGAAPLGSLNATIIGDLFSGKERTAAMGYNSSVLSIGTTLYPAIGGVLAVVSWSYPFLLAFLGIPVGFLVLFGLKNPEPRSDQNLKEYLKNLFLALQDRRIICLIISCGATFIILYGSYLTYLPIFMAERFDASTVVIGLLMSSVSIITAITASQLGRMARRIPERSLLKISFIFYGAALFLVPYVGKIYFLLPIIFLFGFAHGTNIPVTISLLSGLAPMEYRAAFMATNGMVLRAGQTIGPLLMGLMYTIGGVDYTFFTGTGLAIFMFLFLILFFKRPQKNLSV